MNFNIILEKKLLVIFKFIILIPIFVLTLFLFISCEKDRDINTPGQTNPDNSEPIKAADFILKTLDGDSIRLSSLEGKVVVLFFYGNLCSSCRVAAVDIENELIQPYSYRSDFVLLGLDLSNGNSSELESFKSFTGATFPLLFNASSLVSTYETTVDRLIVVDKQGYIQFRGEQAAINDLEVVKTKVEMLLNS